MISFDEACTQVAYDRKAQCPITAITKWFAYKNGVAKEFNSKLEAQTFSKNIDPVTVNNKEITAWWSGQKDLEAKAFKVWMTALESEYLDKNFSQELFNLCYNEAYDRGHYAGYDEVASYMSSVVDFACNVRKLS